MGACHWEATPAYSWRVEEELADRTTEADDGDGGTEELLGPEVHGPGEGGRVGGVPGGMQKGAGIDTEALTHLVTISWSK